MHHKGDKLGRIVGLFDRLALPLLPIPPFIILDLF